MVVGVASFLAYFCFRFLAFEVENSWYGIIFKVKSSWLESWTRQTPYCQILCETREYLVGSNDFPLSFMSHSSRSLGYRET